MYIPGHELWYAKTKEAEKLFYNVLTLCKYKVMLSVSELISSFNPRGQGYRTADQFSSHEWLNYWPTPMCPVVLDSHYRPIRYSVHRDNIHALHVPVNSNLLYTQKTLYIKASLPEQFTKQKDHDCILQTYYFFIWLQSQALDKAMQES